MDFTIVKFIELLSTIKEAALSFQTVEENINNLLPEYIILRHDVDQLPQNSLEFARIENQMGISGTYYFRANPGSFNKQIILEIAALGHEIGYHYETMDTCNGNLVMAYDEFCKNLGTFRELISIKTVCMHGSPLSKFDNRSIWEKYDYRALGLIGEPYFDINFEEVLYLTDTGRRWDGKNVNYRDKVAQHKSLESIPEKCTRQFNTIQNLQNRYNFRSTSDIIKSVKNNEFPNKIMMTFHPQRWSNKPLPWIKELCWQNIKNVGKYFLIKFSK